MKLDGKNRYRIQLYKAFLAYIDENKQEHSYPVYILKFPEKEEDKEAVLRFKEEIPDEIREAYLTTGDPVTLKVDVGGGMDIYDGTVTYQLKLFIHVQNLQFRERVSRREERKIPMVEEGMIYGEGIGEEHGIPVEFRNLSVGGIGFVLKEPGTVIKEKEFYYFYFDKAKTPIKLTFQVRWTRRMDDGRFSAGGQFMGIRRGHEEMIRRYVFDVEREEIKRQKNIVDRMEDMELHRKMLEEKAREIQEEQKKQKGEDGA